MSRTAHYLPSVYKVLVFCAASWGVSSVLHAENPSQWGGGPDKNNVSAATGLPTAWEVGDFDYDSGEWDHAEAENVLWISKLGTLSYGTPVVSGGRVYCATNNGAGYFAPFPATVDLGCLLCFSVKDGRFLWQYSAEKLEEGREVDWPQVGICSAPLVEKDRIWVVTNRCEVVCLDTEGFSDGENDGPFEEEKTTEKNEADVVWKFDMRDRFGVYPHNMTSCSAASYGDLVFVSTSNGVDESHKRIPSPDAPSFLALDKKTGELVWADASPGDRILHGQWASPAVGVFNGVPQVMFPGGDGWLYSFRAERSGSKKPELLWKFDCNPKTARWGGDGQGERNSIVGTPVIYKGRVFIATGQDPENGEGQGDLWCIDPTRRGDVSETLVFDKDGKPAPLRRIQAALTEEGDVVKPNPNSAVVWHYNKHDANGDGEYEFEETMHRTLGMPAIKDDLLFIADVCGLIHCVDAKTGKPHWTYDAFASIWGSALIADGKVYIGDEDGDIAVFELSKEQKLLEEINMGDSVYSTPMTTGGLLYIATRSTLVALKSGAKPVEVKPSE